MAGDVKSYSTVTTVQGKEIEQLRRSLRELFVELVAADEEAAAVLPGQWLPPVDLSESPDMITVKVELPGVDAADLKVSLLGNQLKVTGQKRDEPSGVRPVCYICMERSYGAFSRIFNLPWAIDVQAVAAILNDGLLTITLPKLKDRRRREIVIPVQVKP